MVPFRVIYPGHQVPEMQISSREERCSRSYRFRGSGTGNPGRIAEEPQEAEIPGDVNL